MLARRGDVDAFAELYERGFRCAWAFSMRVHSNRVAAETLTEAILSRAFAGLARFGGEVSWPGWLGAIAEEVLAEGGREAARQAGHIRR